MSFFSRFFNTQQTNRPARRFLTSPDVALKELDRRRKDTRLLEKVSQYFDNDIPSYFGSKPIFYLARHIATPNFETLRFIEISKKFGVDHYIGQDTNDIFTSSNSLKRSVGKMAINISHRDNGERFSYFRIIDFNKAQGSTINSIKTLWGEDLVTFHNNLFSLTTYEPVNILNDSPWIDRNHRGNLLMHYKRFLALFVVHGVMFEYYENGEEDFIDTILAPAFDFVTAEFGVKPLIANLVDPSIEHTRRWEGYPVNVLDHVKGKIGLLTRPNARPTRTSNHVEKRKPVLA